MYHGRTSNASYQKAKRGKVAGPDDAPMEIYKELHPKGEGFKQLMKLLDMVE